MPSWIENKVAYLNGAKIGVGNNYIEITNGGVLKFHGTAKIDDESNTADEFNSIAVGTGGNTVSISTAGVMSFAGTGRLASATIGDGTNNVVVSSAGILSFAGTGQIQSIPKIGGAVNYSAFDIGGYLTLNGTAGITYAGTGKIAFLNYNAAPSASGLFIGSGTSIPPATTATANANWIELRCQTTATSGDNRLAYFRYDIAGAGAGGECLRAFTKVSAATTTSRGSHISLDLAAAGTISGLGVGVDAQIMLAAATTYSAGTFAVVNAEIYTNATSVFTAQSAFFRAVNNGDAKATVDDNSVLLDLTGFTSGSTKLWYDNQGSAPANVEEWIKIRTPAGIRYLAVYNAVV